MSQPRIRCNYVLGTRAGLIRTCTRFAVSGHVCCAQHCRIRQHGTSRTRFQVSGDTRRRPSA